MRSRIEGVFVPKVGSSVLAKSNSRPEIPYKVHITEFNEFYPDHINISNLTSRTHLATFEYASFWYHDNPLTRLLFLK